MPVISPSPRTIFGRDQQPALKLFAVRHGRQHAGQRGRPLRLEGTFLKESGERRDGGQRQQRVGGHGNGDVEIDPDGGRRGAERRVARFGRRGGEQSHQQKIGQQQRHQPPSGPGGQAQAREQDHACRYADP